MRYRVCLFWWQSWLKIKNPKSPAALRIEEGTF
jgi:hypothetical protein